MSLHFSCVCSRQCQWLLLPRATSASRLVEAAHDRCHSVPPSGTSSCRYIHTSSSISQTWTHSQIQHALKDKRQLSSWSDEKISTFDMAKLRLLAELNLDLPKIASLYPKIVRIRIKGSSVQSESPRQEKMSSLSDQNDGNQVDKFSVCDIRGRVNSKLPTMDIPREKYDLPNAVSAMSCDVKCTDSNAAATMHTVNKSEEEKDLKYIHTAPQVELPKKSKLMTGKKTPNFVSNVAKSLLPTSISSKIPVEGVADSAVSRDSGHSSLNTKNDTTVTRKRELVTKASVDRRTKALVLSFRSASSDLSRLVRLEELCKHLLQYPEATNMAEKEGLVPLLLKLRGSRDPSLHDQICQVLALMGFVDPVKGRGIRILTLDGGGTRGLISIEMLKKIEEVCGCPIQDLFDLICGVSTGSLIAMMVGVFRAPLAECENLYRDFSTEMFSRSRLMGAGKLLTSHAYYDAGLFEEILKENIGLKSFLETSSDARCPKIAAVSALSTTKAENYIFRNYNFAPGILSHYPGSCRYRLWQAIRASSAAPGYYEEMKLGGHLHTDGGVLTNNPTAIAIHESKLLWPNSGLQCVVSVGTGRYEPKQDSSAASAYGSLRNKISQILHSATDTEAVHTVLQDLLPPETYFRFNPYMSEDFLLDETNPSKWQQMKYDTQMYCRRNGDKLRKLSSVLSLPKPTHRALLDWLTLQKLTYMKK